MTSTLRPRAAGAVACMITLVLMVPSTATSAAATSPARATARDAPLSIVQLGDSVASGEGTLYGYSYNAKSRTWVGGNINAKWPGPYPLCHDSPDAYGQVVATDLKGQFHQYACTGTTFANGIAAPRVNQGYLYNTKLRPAEFGNWTTGSDLNADYDQAKPDLDLVTLGADDVQFVAIVEDCIENGYEYSLDVASLQCVPSNPGPTIKQDFTDALPGLAANYRTLVSWIEARGKKDGRVPKVVFTNYYDPLPPNGQQCPDSNYLYPSQLEYLSSLIGVLNSTIASTIKGLGDPNVAVADISHALAGHEWCSSDPWAYGLSIYKVTHPSSFESQAPFHPTPAGQSAIAALVEPVADRLLGR
ncbi:MAG: SGNH/GDSL hydrolase family protein [Acidimicrobiales bacterium]